RGEVLLPLPAAAPTRDRGALAGDEQVPAASGQIRSVAGGGDDLGPGRDPDRQRLAIGAVTEGTLAMPTPTGTVLSLAPKALQVAQRVLAEEHHRSSTPPVSPIGTTARDVRFTAEARAAVAAGARLDVNPRAIVEH